ncbi:MAG: hypothetical protein ACJA0P_003043 [Planctomycetota bacterium]|jgi:hypothetical protein
MWALRIEVDQVLAKRSPERSLAEEDHPAKALLFDGADEALGVRVAVRRTRRRENRFNSPTRQKRLEALRELGVAIDDQLRMDLEEAIDGICQVPSDLRHEGLIGRSCRSGDMHSAGRQIDHE